MGDECDRDDAEDRWTDGPVRQADVEGARAWLAVHGLVEAAPSPLLARRLAVRRRARLASSVLVALFIVAVALVYARTSGSPADGWAPYRSWSLLPVAALTGGLVLAQALLDRRVRRHDRQIAVALPRRTAHSVRFGWRTVLGLPRAVFAAATFAGATVLALASLAVPGPTGRYASVVLLIGLCGVAAGTVVQLRHVLTHPVVADDEASLAADGLMRAEDARDVTTPTVLWCLPAASVFDTAPGWWVAAWCVFVALNALALALITVSNGLAARRRGTPLAPR